MTSVWAAVQQHNGQKGGHVCALVLLGDVKREGQTFPPNKLCFSFQGWIVVCVCVCVCRHWHFTLAKQGGCIDLCDCDEFGIVI